MGGGKEEGRGVWGEGQMDRGEGIWMQIKSKPPIKASLTFLVIIMSSLHLRIPDDLNLNCCECNSNT